MNVSYNSTTFNSIEIDNPYLLLDENMVYVNRKWINQRNITLQGNITGNYSQITSKQTSLINTFGQDFKTLQVDDLSFGYCRVNNINFEQSKYQNILNFSVSLLSYGDQFNNINSGVLDPVNEINITENSNGIFSVSQNVSARGINKSTAALNAAKTFVQGLEGITKYNISSLTQFNTNVSSNFCLKNRTESIDRINGVYGIKADYVFDSNLNDLNGITGVAQYSIDFRSGARDDFATASVKGSIDYPKHFYPNATSLTELATLINTNDLKTKAETVLGTANTIPDSFNINTDRGKLDFDFVYTNNTITQPYFDYRLSFQYDKIYSKTTINIAGPVIVKGNLKQRNISLDAFLAGIANMEAYLYSIVNTAYSTWASTVVGNTYILRSKSNSLSVRRSLPNGTLEISASFDDGISAFTNFISNSFSINYNPPIEIYYPRPNCLENGYYIILNPDISTLPILSIRANGLVEKGKEALAESSIKSFRNTIKTACTNNLARTEVIRGENINFGNSASLLQADINSTYTSKKVNQKHNRIVRSVI
jgi:hypothetical protein